MMLLKPFERGSVGSAFRCPQYGKLRFGYALAVTDSLLCEPAVAQGAAKRWNPPLNKMGIKFITLRRRTTCTQSTAESSRFWRPADSHTLARQQKAPLHLRL